MELFCEYYNYSSALSDEISYICRVTAFNRIASTGRVMSIQGTHLEGRSNIDVNTLIVVDQKIENFPRHLYNYYPNLKSISVISCGLKTLSKVDLTGCKRIEKLMLNGNLITSIDSDVFEHAQNLETISFFKNRISFVPDNAFDGLKKLKNVNLEVNSGIDWSCREIKRGSFLDEVKTNLKENFGERKIVKDDRIKCMDFFRAFQYLDNFRAFYSVVIED
ncbi:unnamed protein product [Chironomus riparius]|uniref:Uncharacterized protein n=1 Tax=Chironomus riparius TaxID=315576 RepID=A0A9N9S3W7_9DIPT|nr:unnamed protein product [Chironomus riparius]